MGILKKGSFYITEKIYYGTRVTTQRVNGYIDNDLGIGYDKRHVTLGHYNWVATDIESGVRMATGERRKDAVKNAENIYDKVLEIKKRKKGTEFAWAVYMEGKKAIEAQMKRDENEK